MIFKQGGYFGRIHQAIGEALLESGKLVDVGEWQSLLDPDLPMTKTIELEDVTINWFKTPKTMIMHQTTVEPNLPWAEDHFQERMSGSANPGKEYKNWPWYKQGVEKHKEEGLFSHTYMERYWPVYAGMVEDSPYYSHFVKGKATGVKLSILNKGIRYNYGDLRDVVKLLVKYPDTRQAYLPVWFPEDTGVVHGERVPCSLGYHFIHRHGYFHCIYYIRRCDIYRLFRDDIYLTIRLMLAVLNMCRELGPIYWDIIKPGIFTMYTTSLHMFVNDRRFIQQVVDNIDQNL